MAGAETAGKGGDECVEIVKGGVVSVGGSGIADAIAALGGMDWRPYAVC